MMFAPANDYIYAGCLAVLLWVEVYVAAVNRENVCRGFERHSGLKGLKLVVFQGMPSMIDCGRNTLSIPTRHFSPLPEPTFHLVPEVKLDTS
jgi:hypothetical protein